MKSDFFYLQHCRLRQTTSSHKIGTDAVILGAFTEHNNPLRILDVGTGTGIIALMMAQKYPAASIDALDISEHAYSEASENFSNSPWSSQLTCHLKDAHNFCLQTSNSYDIIISNPPFFHNSLLSNNSEKNNARHTHSLSPETLIDAAAVCISQKGIFTVIIPYSDMHRYCIYAQSYHFFLIHSFVISPFAESEPNRIVLIFSPTFKAFSKENLFIYNNDTTYSEKYKVLTKSFLTHF
ncbi:MAG: tRNA1(Val) (adenine(37)-N6)-methyltransferase [Bacteroidota bacterium]